MKENLRAVPKHARVSERRLLAHRRGTLARLESMFGPAPLTNGEDEIAYLDFFDEVRTAVAPRDMIDEIFARELADLQWEILRFRREQARVQRAAFRALAIRRIHAHNPALARTLDQSDGLFAAGWKRIFKALGIAPEEVQAEALTRCLADVERIEALVSRKQARWMLLSREPERRREAAERVEVLAKTRLLAAPDPVES